MKQARVWTSQNHPGCIRTIELKKADGVADIVGLDSDDGGRCIRGAKGKSWKIRGTIIATEKKDGGEEETRISVDFSTRGGPSDAIAVVGKDQVTFNDGSSWRRLNELAAGEFR